MADTSNERFTWTLVCSGRVLGSKSSAGADNLLRLHKKKCKMCYDTKYVCVDESNITHYHKGANQFKQEQDRYASAVQKLMELLPPSKWWRKIYKSQADLNYLFFNQIQRNYRKLKQIWPE